MEIGRPTQGSRSAIKALQESLLLKMKKLTWKLLLERGSGPKPNVSQSIENSPDPVVLVPSNLVEFVW